MVDNMQRPLYLLVGVVSVNNLLCKRITPGGGLWMHLEVICGHPAGVRHCYAFSRRPCQALSTEEHCVAWSKVRIWLYEHTVGTVCIWHCSAVRVMETLMCCQLCQS